jgi:predicted membrane protein
MKRSSNTWWGVALIVVGVLLFLGNYYELDLRELIRTWWPLVLVIWGAALIMRYRSERPTGADAAPAGYSPSESQPASGSPERILQSGIFGDTTVRVSSQTFKGGTVSTVFGDTSIDLSSAALSEGEQVLKVSGVFGDTTITVPHDMAFSATVNTLFGDAQVIDQKKEGLSSSITFQVPEYAGATRKLRIHASQVFGDIVVRR